MVKNTRSHCSMHYDSRQYVEKIDKQKLFQRIGRTITHYRKVRGLTQQTLAERTYRSCSTISRLERGTYNHNIPLSTLVDIANVLQLPLSVFFEGFTGGNQDETR